MIYQNSNLVGGKVLSSTGEPLAFATITAVNINGQRLGYTVQANNQGLFNIDILDLSPGVYLEISAAEHVTKTFSESQYKTATEFKLERKSGDLDPVVITAGGKQDLKKAGWIIGGALALWFLFFKDKKRGQ